MTGTIFFMLLWLRTAACGRADSAATGLRLPAIAQGGQNFRSESCAGALFGPRRPNDALHYDLPSRLGVAPNEAQPKIVTARR